MKNPFLFFLVFTFFVGGIFAQTTSDTDGKLKLLMEKNAEYHRKTDGKYDGYRIKIHFGIDKTKAHEIKGKFLSKYPEASAYDEYQQPNFVVVVGDFKTRPEAFELFKKIQGDFPNAFIIKDKIRPVKL
ncbi:MAG TPA: SPOR domain-containing protein [Nitrosopumilaceae archaeon]|nr:SPOR domain-containing protein [Nitrosopumilaceae archaeon]